MAFCDGICVMTRMQLQNRAHDGVWFGHGGLLHRLC